MDIPYISIPATDISQFSETTQIELLRYLGFSKEKIEGNSFVPTQNREGVMSSTEDGPVELTPLLIKKLTKNLSKNTLIALQVIARSKTEEFHIKDVIDAIEGAKDYMDLRGIWSGLTRRTRNILQDSDADFIWWGDDKYDDDDNHIDQIGEVSKLTLKSLKSHFSIKEL